MLDIPSNCLSRASVWSISFGCNDSIIGLSLPNRQSIKPSLISSKELIFIYLQSNRSRGCCLLKAAVIFPPYSWPKETVRALQPMLNSSLALSHNGISIVSPMMPRFVPFTSILTVASPNVHRSFHTFGLGTTTMPGMVFSRFLLTSNSLSLILRKLVALS